MSDILDALRKAELQRENARSPGILPQQRYAAAPPAGNGWRWGGGGAFVLGLFCAGLLAAYGGLGDYVAKLEAAPAGNAQAQPESPVPRLSLNASGARVGPGAVVRTPGPRREPSRGVSTLDDAPDMSAAEADDAAAETAVDAVAVVATSDAHAISPPLPLVPAVAPPSPVPPVAAAPAANNTRPPGMLGAQRLIAPLRDPFEPDPPPAPVERRSERKAGTRTHAPGLTVLTEAAAGEVESVDPVPLLRTLPYRFQSVVPKMVINAQAYAMVIEDRFVIINMRKYSEGEKTMDGVSIESIRQQDIVLAYQGQQFRLQR